MPIEHQQAYFIQRQKRLDIEAEVSKKTVTEASYRQMINKFSATFD